MGLHNTRGNDPWVFDLSGADDNKNKIKGAEKSYLVTSFNPVISGQGKL